MTDALEIHVNLGVVVIPRPTYCCSLDEGQRVAPEPPRPRAWWFKSSAMDSDKHNILTPDVFGAIRA